MKPSLGRDPVPIAGLVAALVAGVPPRRIVEGEAGVLSDLDVIRFNREAGPRLLASNLLRLFALDVGGRLVAASYGHVHGREVYAYLDGFDPAHGCESPGTALTGHAIADALARGCARFHFLRGREPYKYACGTEDQWNVVCRLQADHPVTRPGRPAQQPQASGRV